MDWQQVVKQLEPLGLLLDVLSPPAQQRELLDDFSDAPQGFVSAWALAFVLAFFLFTNFFFYIDG